MLCVKETVRLYKSQIHANHGVGALKRFGWEVRGVPTKLELAKGKIVWEVRAVRGLSLLVRLYDAYVAARAAMLKVLRSA